MRLWNFLTNHWRLIYGIGAGLCLFYAVMGLAGEPDFTADTIIYTQIILRELGLTFVIPAVAVLSLGIIGYFLRYHVADNRSFVMFIVPLLAALYVLFFVSQPAIGDQRLFHQNSVRVGGHVYNLAGYEVGRLVAYECDVLGVVCHVIYRGGAITSLKYCADSPRWEIRADNLSLVVHCETVFTHHVQ